MGALHEGHLSLVRDRHRVADRVVVSIFVNPTQFGPSEDFARYPRDLARDLRDACAGVGADVVFTPSVDEMYPNGDADLGHRRAARERRCAAAAGRATSAASRRWWRSSCIAVQPHVASSARRTTSSSR